MLVESLAPGEVVDEGGITVVFGGTTVVLGGPELVGGGMTVVFGGTTVVLGGPELVAGGITVVFGGTTVVFGGLAFVGGGVTCDGGVAPGVTALDGEGFVRGCGAAVGEVCAEVLGGRAPALGAALGVLAAGALLMPAPLLAPLCDPPLAAPALAPLLPPAPPPAAPPAPPPPLCENATLVAANKVSAASTPAASHAARR